LQQATPRTRVLIVEDEPEFLQHFSQAVTADASLELLGSVASGRAGLALLAGQPPDVLLVDLGLPDVSGIELIRYAAQHLPDCDVLVVTMFADDEHVIGSIEAGAAGYLLKDAHAERVAQAIHEVRAGGSPISPSIARRVLARFRVAPAGPEGAQAGTVPNPSNPSKLAAGSPTAPGPASGADTSPLTDRETEILRLVAKGLSFEVVSSLLGISPHTVVTHVKKIYRKLAVNSRGEAVYEASQMGLL
jgi:DNA-binding NarL/FixJ family response regulator